MKRIILLFFILGQSILSAVMLEVKSADVVIDIDGKKYSLVKGKRLEVREGSTVTFLEGKGRIIINKRQIRAKSKTKSYTLPKSTKNENLIANFKNYIVEMGESIDDSTVKKHGIATKAVETTLTSSQYDVLKTDTHILIGSDQFGPLPTVAKVYDAKKSLQYEVFNEDIETTLFIFEKKDLRVGYTVVIENAFEDQLLTYSVE